MSKYSADEKIQICEEYLSGKSGASELCIEYGLSKGKPPGAFWNWISRYQKYGRDAFLKGAGIHSYTKEVKEQAVKEYLAEAGCILRPVTAAGAVSSGRCAVTAATQLIGHSWFNHHGVVLGCTLQDSVGGDLVIQNHGAPACRFPLRANNGAEINLTSLLQNLKEDFHLTLVGNGM